MIHRKQKNVIILKKKETEGDNPLLRVISEFTGRGEQGIVQTKRGEEKDTIIQINKKDWDEMKRNGKCKEKVLYRTA